MKDKNLQDSRLLSRQFHVSMTLLIYSKSDGKLWNSFKVCLVSTLCKDYFSRKFRSVDNVSDVFVANDRTEFRILVKHKIQIQISQVSTAEKTRKILHNTLIGLNHVF